MRRAPDVDSAIQRLENCAIRLRITGQDGKALPRFQHTGAVVQRARNPWRRPQCEACLASRLGKE